MTFINRNDGRLHWEKKQLLFHHFQEFLLPRLKKKSSINLSKKSEFV